MNQYGGKRGNLQLIRNSVRLSKINDVTIANGLKVQKIDERNAKNEITA